MVIDNLFPVSTALDSARQRSNSTKVFGVSGEPFKMGMGFLSLPASTALYVLASQLNGAPLPGHWPHGSS